MNEHYLSDEDFFSIYSKVPRLGVDLIIESGDGILLALRSIEPYIGHWHLPGGTVYKDELIEEASVRVAKKETGLAVVFVDDLGYMEYPHESRAGVGIHTVTIAVKVRPVGGALTPDEGATELRYFKELPEKVISTHREFLKKKKILG